MGRKPPFTRLKNMVMELIDKNGAATANPREFSGQWFFTNPDTEDFTFFWNGTPYTFEAMKTSPFLIVDATPIEMQSIRKQAAYKLAQRMFGKSPKYKKLEKDSQGKSSPQYYDPKVEYEPFIQQCLTALPVAQAKMGKKQKRSFDVHTDPKTGKPVTKVLGEADMGSTSLVDEAAREE